jgi:hypothetical protein
VKARWPILAVGAQPEATTGALGQLLEAASDIPLEAGTLEVAAVDATPLARLDATPPASHLEVVELA